MNTIASLQLQHLHTLDIYANKVHSVAISPNLRYIATSGGNDRRGTSTHLQIWDLNTGQYIHHLEGHTADINSVAISPDNQKIISVSADSSVRFWDFNKGKEIYCRQQQDRKEQVVYHAVTISPDAKHFITASSKDIKIWDLKTGRELDSISSNTRHNYIYALAISPDGNTLFSGGGSNSIQIWDLRTKQEIYKFTGHSSVGRSLCISPDGKTLVSGGDQRIKVWDLETGKVRLSFYGHADLIRGVVITPDGNTLISAGDRFIKMWDLNTGKKTNTVEAHDDAIRGLALSSDGTILASGGVNGKVRIWQISKG